MFVASTLVSTSARQAKSANLNDFSVIDHPWFRRPMVANTGRSLGDSCPAACRITGNATAEAAAWERNRRRERLDEAMLKDSRGTGSGSMCGAAGDLRNLRISPPPPSVTLTPWRWQFCRKRHWPRFGAGDGWPGEHRRRKLSVHGVIFSLSRLRRRAAACRRLSMAKSTSAVQTIPNPTRRVRSNGSP